MHPFSFLFDLSVARDEYQWGRGSHLYVYLEMYCLAREMCICIRVFETREGAFVCLKLDFHACRNWISNAGYEREWWLIRPMCRKQACLSSINWILQGWTRDEPIIKYIEIRFSTKNVISLFLYITLQSFHVSEVFVSPHKIYCMRYIQATILTIRSRRELEITLESFLGAFHEVDKLSEETARK